MTNQEIINEIKEDHNDSGEWNCGYDYDGSDYLEVVESEEWIQHYELQHRQVVYYSSKHSIYIAINESRSGSSLWDWYYETCIVEVCKPMVKTITKEVTEWVTV